MAESDGKCKVPESLRRLKPKGTIAKAIRGKFCVCEHRSAKDPATGKWKTAPGLFG